jgi:hypothetical protein
MLLGAFLALGLAARGRSAGVVVDIDFFRAMGNRDANAFTEENDDMADLTGVIKYIHTEVIAEHIIGNPDRNARKYGIDVIVNWRFKLQNTPGLLQNAGHNVDFGNFLAFDLGQDTDVSLMGDKTVQQWGDYVGIQNQVDARYPTMGNFYWFDVSGFCPNLPWSCTRGWYPPCDHPMAPTARCTIDEPCPGKGNSTHPSEKCIRYFASGEVAKGGLCSRDDETVIPTGEPGCVYNYMRSTVKKINLDVIAGLNEVECRGRDAVTRKCNGFYDFRKNCTDHMLKRMFAGDGTVLNNVGFCVEYDIHPACVNKCDDPKCLAARQSGAIIELGVPFWQGRCSAENNQVRHELFADAFGIEGALTKHANTNADILAKPAACGKRGYGTCNPDGSGEVGGPYCTRHVSGVCTMCYIPGTLRVYPDADATPICPTDILDYPDYQGLNEPKCKQADAEGNLHAKDLCCLYTGFCLNALQLPTQTDENGFAYYWAKGTTQGLIEFFTMLVQKKYDTPYVVDQKGLETLLYKKWFPGRMPLIKPADYDGIVDQIKGFYSKDSLAPTSAPTAPPTPSPPDVKKDTFPLLWEVVVGIAVVVVIGLGVVCFVVNRKKQQERERALLMEAPGMSLPTHA